MQNLNSKKTLTFALILFLIVNCISQSQTKAITSDFPADPNFESIPVLHSDGRSLGYPQMAIKSVESFFDNETRTLHIAGWHYLDVDYPGVRQLLHLVVQPDQKVSVITVAKTGDPEYPISLSPYDEGAIRLVWLTRYQQGATSQFRFNQYIWYNNGSTSLSSLPPLLAESPVISLDNMNRIHIASLSQSFSNDTHNLLQLRLAYENQTKWIEENIPLIPITLDTYFYLYNALFLPNQTLAILARLDSFNKTADRWEERILLLKIFEKNLVAQTYSFAEGSQEWLSYVELAVSPNESIILLVSTQEGLRKGIFRNGDLIIEALTSSADLRYVERFTWTRTPNGILLVAYATPVERWSDEGIISLLQQGTNGTWTHSFIDSDHKLRGIYAWHNSVPFDIISINDAPFLIFASVPTKSEQKDLNLSQDDICSLYLAFKSDNSLFGNVKPGMLDLDNQKESILSINNDWFLFTLVFVSLAILGICVVLLRKLRRQKKRVANSEEI
ncbi:MAG: hypothetical protein ACFFB3_15420 [Candidatus Hodarchaeota archaeon]